MTGFPFVTSLDIRQNGCIVSPLSSCELSRAMANYRRAMSWFLTVLALASVGGCEASGPQIPFETAYSAIGAQVK
jgi:hypothetical protein